MPIIGSIILTVGALAGIWLGAYYAAGRLAAQFSQQAVWFKEQRDEDARRLGRQLRAESERLGKQLEHDQRVRDVEDVRRVLDDVVVPLGEAIEATAHARHLMVDSTVLAEFTEDDEALLDERLDALRYARKTTAALPMHWQRLRLRFGTDQEVSKSFWGVRDVLVSTVKVLGSGAENLSAEQIETARNTHQFVAPLYAQFMDAALKYVKVSEESL